MNILYILPVPNFFSQINNIGGHIAHVYGIINTFTKQGYKLDILAEESNTVLNNNYKSLNIISLGSKSLIKRQFWALKIINKATQLNSENNPIFCYIRYSAGFSLWLPLLKKKIKNTPLIIEVNSFASQRIKLFRLIEKRALKNADLITVISERVKTDILKLLDKDLEDKIIVIPNGVDVERFESKRNTNIAKKNEIHLAYIGILKFNYGLDDLLCAFKQIIDKKENVFLHIVGEGPFFTEMKEKARNIPNIIFHGSKPFFEIPEIVQNFDILLNTSSKHISFQSPTKIYEYMASGKPIISAENQQVKKILGNEERGLLYPIGDVNTFAEKIIKLIDDKNLAKKISVNALKAVKEKHSWDARVAKLILELKNRAIIDD